MMRPKSSQALLKFVIYFSRKSCLSFKKIILQKSFDLNIQTFIILDKIAKFL